MNHHFNVKKRSTAPTKVKQDHRQVYVFTFGVMNNNDSLCTSCYAMPMRS